MVHAPAIARTSSSAASLLWPYGVTGDGERVSSMGFPGVVGPAAAREETSTKRPGDACAAASSTFAVPSRLARMNSSVSRALRSEEHTSELQSQSNLVCRLLLE